jgi:hypothetical protein
MIARLPFDGAQRGLPAVLRHAFRRSADGAQLWVCAETFLRFGDSVLVVGRLPGWMRRKKRRSRNLSYTSASQADAASHPVADAAFVS